MNYLTEIPSSPPRADLRYVEARNRVAEGLTYRAMLLALERAMSAPSESLRRHYVQQAHQLAGQFLPI